MTHKYKNYTVIQFKVLLVTEEQGFAAGNRKHLENFARWEQNWLKVLNFKWAQRLPNGKVSSCKIMQDVPE